jgi:DNA-binding MarR family transcriptional regulator
VVKSRITAKGLRLLEEIEPCLAAHHQKQFAGFGEKKLKQWVEWLEQIRESV